MTNPALLYITHLLLLSLQLLVGVSYEPAKVDWFYVGNMPWSTMSMDIIVVNVYLTG